VSRVGRYGGLAVTWALGGVLSAAAGATTAVPDPASLDRFLATNVPFCMKAPAVQCIDQGFSFADRDQDGQLSLTEVQAIQGEVAGWAKSNGRRLPPAERDKLIVGLLLIQTVGPQQLFASYDGNRDGALTREELTADIRLDKRPLPEILSDPSSIDWNGLAARAGDAAPLLKKLFEL
jgi:EF hand domain-containing protein